MATAIDIERDAVERAYDRWAPVYDLVFGPVFERGRRAAIAAAERIGGRILEVGVGTGISLPDYSRGEPHLRRRHLRGDARKARERVDRARPAPRRGARGDGRRAARISRTIRSTSWSRNMSSPRCRNPEAALDEFARVLKPGGEIVILSRVGAEAGLRRTIEHCLQPAARKLGWRTEFPWERYAPGPRARPASI